MLAKRHSIIFFTFILIIGIGSQVFGQDALIFPKSNSPYSRFGIGNIAKQYFVASAGMGGVSATHNDPFHLNLVNPASLAHLKATAFEVGIFAENTTLNTADGEAEDIWSGNLGYLALGFPLKNPINRAIDRSESPWDFGMSFSLTPYSLVGYNITNRIEDEEFIVATNKLKGDGGTYSVGWGNAVRYKNFSVGLNIGYQFGKITNNRRIEFDSLNAVYNVDFVDELSIGAFSWKAGVQYAIDLDQTVEENEGKRILIGAYGNGRNSFSTRSNRTTFGQNLSYAVDADTLSNVDNGSGSGKLPAEYGIGVMYENINNLRIGLDYTSTLWSNYENDVRDEAFSNAWKMRAGMEFIPDIASIDSYWERVRYRFGVFAGKDYRSFNGNQLNEWGITAGIGFPIIIPRTQKFSFVNLAVEYSSLGIDDGLKENYFKLNFGFTLNDNQWFFKRKFN